MLLELVGWQRDRKSALAALVLVTLACTFLVVRSAQLNDDGAEDLRHVKLAMHDEELILSRVWPMVERGDLQTRMGVYPGLYLYTVAAMRVLIGPSAPDSTHVRALRWLSLLLMLAGLLVPFVLLLRLTDAPLACAVFLAAVAVHPETVLWASRIHPDAMLLLFDHTALALFALHLRNGRERTLYAATVMTALAAGTKLVGFFIMPCIVVYLAWRHRHEPRLLLLALARHSLLFLGVLALTTPLLVNHTGGVVRGWLIQNDRNANDGPGRGAWFDLLIGPRGLGLAGSLAAALAVVALTHRRALQPLVQVSRQLWVFAGFGLFFLTYLLARVNLALPRYAMPAIWPLFLTGALALRPSAFVQRRVGWGVVTVLGAIFLLHDVPARWGAINEELNFYASNFSADKRAVADLVVAQQQRRPGTVVSSHAMFVPKNIDWDPVWWLYERDVVLQPTTTAVIVGPELTATPTGQTLPPLSALGYTLAQRIGPYEVYTR